MPYGTHPPTASDPPDWRSFPPGLIDLGRGHRAELLGDAARVAEGPQDVAAEDLADVGIGVAAPQQLVGEAGEARDVLEADWPGGDAVEVGADADVVDAGDLGDVVDVVGDVG